jgi:hypothetical protein
LLGVTVKGAMIDKLLATGVIIEGKSTICRDDPEWYKGSDVYRRMPELFMRNGSDKRLEKPTKDDLESNLIFHVKDFPTVAAVVHPFRRRKLSPEHRKRSVEALRKARAARNGPSEPDFAPKLSAAAGHWTIVAARVGVGRRWSAAAGGQGSGGWGWG